MKNRVIYALGFFDGVHLGHQALLKACRRLATEANARSGAVTFSLPPAALLGRDAPGTLNTTYDRVSLLKEYGMDDVTVLPTDCQTLSMSYQDFLESLISRGAAGFVCGNDFRFGKNGAGNADILESYCREQGLLCAVVPEQTMDGARISSTRIRTLLEQGDVTQANKLLGHPHIFTGTVVSGQQLGRTIDIPTANLLLPQGLLTLKFGVYACKAMVDGEEYLAVTNVGNRPTVGGENVTVEAHLLDFDGDLYGKELKIAFFAFLRPEEKFSSLAQLQKEIQKNLCQTRNFFEKS